MSEGEPWSDRTMLRRFEADLKYASSPFDLYNAFVSYMERQFLLSEEASTALHNQAILTGDLPNAAAYEKDAAEAGERTRLALVTIAMPFAESLIENTDTFSAWAHDVSRTAIGSNDSLHDVDRCILVGDGLGCERRAYCPVRVVKYELVHEVTSPNFDSPDYIGAWAPAKIVRTLAKLTVAQHLGLTAPVEADALRRSYLFRSQTRGLFLPDETDI